MYDIDTKFIKKEIIPFIIVFVIGVIGLVLYVVFQYNAFAKEKRMDGQVKATHIEVISHYDSEDGEMYSPVYYYVVRGEEYECRTNFSSSIYPDLDKDMVYYNTENPSECVTDYSKKNNKLFLIFIILPLGFILLPLYKLVAIHKRIKIVEELNQRGKLIKGLPYTMQYNGEVNGKSILVPIVVYRLPNGEFVTLKGDARYDNRNHDEDGLVDLVIDETDPKKYFIDFEINRLTGNTKDDYYVDPNSPQQKF